VTEIEPPNDKTSRFRQKIIHHKLKVSCMEQKFTADWNFKS